MPTQLEGLTLASLRLLDPRIEGLFCRQMQIIAADCMNRPREKGKRKLTFELICEPVPDPETGECEEVKVSIDAHSSVPRFRTRPYPMQVTKAGMKFEAEVHDDSPATV
jgi:hypothetical protein